MKSFFCVLILIISSIHLPAQNTTSPVLKTAVNHPMQYYISLPQGWNKNKKCPVVLVIESADKEYKVNAERFIKARGSLPFIIVAPFIVTNGSQGQRDPAVFPYSTVTWDRIDKEGVCKFDKDGINQIMADVKKTYNTEEKYFITGFEAGNHLLWTLVLQQPGQLYAAAPVAGNFIGRCMDANLFSTDPGREQLPIKSFFGEKDEYWAKGFHKQDLNARTLAKEHGYKNISEQEIKNKGHEPLPDEVIAYFSSLYNSSK
jgi:predicted peptidase